MALEFYKKLYSTEPVAVANSLDWNFPSLRRGEKRSFTRYVSEVEVKPTAFQMDPLKSSGPDGISPCFCKKLWDVMGEVVVLFVRQAFFKGEFHGSLNKSLIALLPNMDALENITHMRPMGFCNS